MSTLWRPRGSCLPEGKHLSTLPWKRSSSQMHWGHPLTATQLIALGIWAQPLMLIAVGAEAAPGLLLGCSRVIRGMLQGCSWATPVPAPRLALHSIRFRTVVVHGWFQTTISFCCSVFPGFHRPLGYSAVHRGSSTGYFLATAELFLILRRVAECRPSAF